MKRNFFYFFLPVFLLLALPSYGGSGRSNSKPNPNLFELLREPNRNLVLEDWRRDREPERIRAVVLLIHWGDESPRFQFKITSETLLPDLDDVEEFFNTASFGLLDLQFDICEKTTKRSLPSDPVEAIRKAMQYCDRDIFYPDYQWVLVYPMNLDSAGVPVAGTSYGNSELPSADGLIETQLIGLDYRLHAPFGTIIHEGGHALGLSHASALYCDDETLSVRGKCRHEEYGDPFDIMGGGMVKNYNCPMKHKLGWVRAPENVILASDGTYTIANWERETVTPQCLKLWITPSDVDFESDDLALDPYENLCRNLYIEYRGLTDELLVHCWTAENGGRSHLIDCSPSDDDDENLDLSLRPGAHFGLHPGETCQTGVGYDITFVESSSSRATVNIESSD